MGHGLHRCQGEPNLHRKPCSFPTRRTNFLLQYPAPSLLIKLDIIIYPHVAGQQPSLHSSACVFAAALALRVLAAPAMSAVWS